MEKRRRNTRNNLRRRYRNQKSSTKELVLNLLLKQLGISIFLFLLIMILQFIPLKSTVALTQNIDEAVSYNMTWDEALKTVKNTAVYIPVVRNWVEEDQTEKMKTDEDLSDTIQEEHEAATMDTENSSTEYKVLDQSEKAEHEEDVVDSIPVSNTEDIFILEPELGESEETTVP